MAIGTIASRITGFARDLVLVWAIGTAVFADTYNVANTVPNVVYILSPAACSTPSSSRSWSRRCARTPTAGRPTPTG